MVDTHAHLGLCEPSVAELVEAARREGVRRILTVGLDEESNAQAISHAAVHEEVFACVGRHPNSADGFGDADAEALERAAGARCVAAVGETGLDYYREGAAPEAQRRAFTAQIEIARRVGKPLVIHLRDGPGGDAVGEAFELLGSAASGVEVILHCFSASDRVGEAAAHGWYCSFAGNLTYPRADELRAAAREVPDELALVETDAPFLAPQPLRGKPNQPANVGVTAATLAQVRGADPAELEAQLERNAARVLGW